MSPRLLFRGALLLLLAAPPRAFADPPKAPPAGDKKPEAKASAYSVEVMVLHATNSDEGIDSRIGSMPELKKPPFSAYKSYKFLQKVEQPLVEEQPQTLQLPNGRVLKTALLAKLPSGHVKLSASINQAGGKTFLPLLEVKAKVGQPFIVAGQAYKGGILVLVLRVVK